MKTSVHEKITTELKRHKKTMSSLMRQMKSQILKLPENKAYSPTDTTSQYTVTETRNGIVVEYVSFKRQYEYVVESVFVLDKDPFTVAFTHYSANEVLTRLHSIINRGNIPVCNSRQGCFTVKLHAEVIKNLKKLLGQNE